MWTKNKNEMKITKIISTKFSFLSDVISTLVRDKFDFVHYALGFNMC
eukprot:gene14-5_t